MKYLLRREVTNFGLPSLRIKLWGYETMFANCIILQIDFYSLTAIWEGDYPDKSYNTVP